MDDEPFAGPVGLQVEAGDDTVAEEEWQAVIAKFPLLGRRVDLDPVVEIEQALGARALPYEGIEGRDERPRLDSARDPRLGIEVERFLSALDRDGPQGTLLDEFGKARAGIRDAEAEIVA